MSVSLVQRTVFHRFSHQMGIYGSLSCILYDNLTVIVQTAAVYVSLKAGWVAKRASCQPTSSWQKGSMLMRQ
jgi:hypothetical protein